MMLVDVSTGFHHMRDFEAKETVKKISVSVVHFILRSVLCLLEGYPYKGGLGAFSDLVYVTHRLL